MRSMRDSSSIATATSGWLPSDLRRISRCPRAIVISVRSDADRRFPDADPRLEGFIVSTAVRRYVQAGAPADFRPIVSPLAQWIWIGGVIVVGGAMVALWPAPRRARRAGGRPIQVGAGPDRSTIVVSVSATPSRSRSVRSSTSSSAVSRQATRS